MTVRQPGARPWRKEAQVHRVGVLLQVLDHQQRRAAARGPGGDQEVVDHPQVGQGVAGPVVADDEIGAGQIRGADQRWRGSARSAPLHPQGDGHGVAAEAQAPAAAAARGAQGVAHLEGARQLEADQLAEETADRPLHGGVDLGQHQLAGRPCRQGLAQGQRRQVSAGGEVEDSPRPFPAGQRLHQLAHGLVIADLMLQGPSPLPLGRFGGDGTGLESGVEGRHGGGWTSGDAVRPREGEGDQEHEKGRGLRHAGIVARWPPVRADSAAPRRRR